MQSKVLKRLWLVLAASTIAASLFLAGCEGDDGDDGAPGRDAGRGPIQVSDLTSQQQADLNVQGEVLSVSNDARPVVRFRLTDKDGDPVIGLGQRNTAGTQLQNLSFGLAKLVPGTNGSPSQWVNYIVTSAPSTTTPPAATTGSRPTTEREGTLVDNGDGTYTYTFARDIRQAAAQVAALPESGNNRNADLGNLTYDPNLTHRLVILYSGNVLNSAPTTTIENPLNLVYDYIPASGAKVTAANSGREIVLTQNCNECHGSLLGTPHNFAYDTRVCVVCHTSQRAYGRAIVNADATGNYPPTRDTSGNTTTARTYVSESGGFREVMGDFTVLVHKIHQGEELTRNNYSYAGVEFDRLGYPQSSGLCRKCHRENADAPQANNWFNAPSRKGCGSCHDNINFTTGVNIATGGSAHPPVTNDANCRTCHTPTTIQQNHQQENVTPLNPTVDPALANFKYEIASANVDPATNNLTIRFRVLNNGTPVSFVAPAATVTAPLTGFTGSPSFLLAYAMPQRGFQNQNTAQPIDYNNLGRPAAQPASISIASLLSTTSTAPLGVPGTLSTRDAEGYYTATINSANAFPAGAKMRSVSMQSYFTQTAGTNGIAANTARHAVAVVKPVTGDAVRRTVVDPAKCAKCHEWFEAHGGQRVYETQVCVTCHNPNLTTSGRTLTDAQVATRLDETDRAILTTWNFDFTATDAALGFPETSNNFKEMIHGIHAGGTRTNAFRDVRNGPGTTIAVIDAAYGTADSPFVFPNMLKNCEACHITATAGSTRKSFEVNLPANVLPTTMVTRNATTPATPASISAARSTVPNPEDLVVPPITGACVSCHDTPEAVAHMQANGGQLWTGSSTDRPANWAANNNVGTPRIQMNPTAEQCALCHGPGKVADVDKVHNIDVDADDENL